MMKMTITRQIPVMYYKPPSISPGRMIYLDGREFGNLVNILIFLEFTSAITTVFGAQSNYTLASSSLPGAYVRVKFAGQDKLGKTYTLTSDSVNLNKAPNGAISISLIDDIFNATSELTLDTTGFSDPNGGRFINYAWEIGPPVVITGIAKSRVPDGSKYTLNINDFNRLHLGYEIRATAIYEDNFQQSYTLVAGRTFEALAALGNIPTEAELSLLAPVVAAPGEVYQVTLNNFKDQNGIGQLFYQWQARRGTNDSFTVIHNETESKYTINAGHFTGSLEESPELKVIVTHRDLIDNETTLASAVTLMDQLPSLLSLAVSAKKAGATVSLIAPVADPNGIKNKEYLWKSNLATLSATNANYIIKANDFNPATSLMLEVKIEDSFGIRSTIYSAWEAIAVQPTGAIEAQLLGGAPTLNALVTVLTMQLSDANGGSIDDYHWGYNEGATLRTNSNTYTLVANDLRSLRAGKTLQIVATHSDSLGFATKINTAYTLSSAQNIQNQPPQGNLQIKGPVSYSAETTLTADVSQITDGNGIEHYDFYWQVSYDQGLTYDNLFTGGSVLIQTTNDWDGARMANGNLPQVQAQVVLLDKAGYLATISAHHRHADQLPPPPVLTATSSAPGALVKTQSEIVDSNILRKDSIRHRWEAGDIDFTHAKPLAITRADYNLTAGDFAPTFEYLRRITEYQDWFGTSTTLTTSPIKINQPTQGTLHALLLGQRLETGATVQVFAQNVSDSNAGALGNFLWEKEAITLTTGNVLILTEELKTAISAGETINVLAVHTDGLGWETTLSTKLMVSSNAVEQATQGAPQILGSFNFTAGAKYTLNTSNLIDANGIGVFSHSWQKSIDGGSNWQRINTGANDILVLSPSMFAGIAADNSPALRAVVTHYDSVGFRQTLTSAAHLHQYLPAQASLSLVFDHLRPGGKITLLGEVTSSIGIKQIDYIWTSAPDLLFNQPTVIGANKNYYLLKTSDINPAAAIKVQVNITDSYNQTTTIYPEPLAIARRAQGKITLVIKDSILRPGTQIEAVTIGLHDANGGEIINYHWEFLGEKITLLVTSTNPTYGLDASNLSLFAHSAPLKFQAVHRDEFNYKSTIAAQIINNISDSPSAIAHITLNGNASFSAGAIYSVAITGLTDANGVGTITYRWGTRGGTARQFAAIPHVTGSLYTINMNDFNALGNNELAVSITHTDLAGFQTSWTTSRSHIQETPAEVTINLTNFTPGAIARAEGIAALGTNINYQWQHGNNTFNDISRRDQI